MHYETITYDLADGVGVVTLNRPAKLNTFNPAMCEEFADLWARVREDDEVRCLVLRAAGDHFSVGLDVKEGRTAMGDNPWNGYDPGDHLSPKRNRVWKPIIAAVQGMCAGGAFYWVNESDIVICSDDATFFDPHTTYGMTAALEPIGMAYRMPLGDVLRMVLLGLDERMSPQRALEVGLVTEVVERSQLWKRADELAALVAAKPPWSVQGSIKAIWQSLDLTRTQALDRAFTFPQLTKLVQEPVDRGAVRPDTWTVR
ncbi:MAG TPA: enoyl-CoA hydratase/isomerase family protein [Acidimicrobiales bacterium]|nr:enoyl-CoA hydratase/isomerase family protein [Acidimicrobiales bacterium]